MVLIPFVALATAKTTTLAITAFTNGVILGSTLYTASRTNKVTRTRVKK